MARVDKIDIYEAILVPSVSVNMSMGFSVIFEKSLFVGTYRIAIIPMKFI